MFLLSEYRLAGAPVASALFGDGAAMVIIAAYVGSSLFGNAIGVGLLAQGQHWRARLRQTLQAPPVWALLVGLACLPWGRCWNTTRGLATTR